MARARKSKTSRKIDFADEVKYFEPDQDVELVVKKATWEDGNEHPYISIEFNGVGEFEESILYHNASASPKSLHRMRMLLQAFGIDVPDGPLDIDTDELVDMHCMAHTYEDRFKGDDGKERISVKADDFWPVDEKAAKGKAAKGKKEEEETEVEALDRDEVEAMDRDELSILIEEHELDVDPDSRKLKKDDDALLAAVVAALEEKELLEEAKPAKKGRAKKEPEEEEPAKGKASSKAGAKSSKKKSADKTWSEEEIQEMSEEELEAVIEEAEIEVDLEEHRTLRKKKNAVVDALEEAEKIEK